ncbi:hypothetical protein JDV02_003357 [Purpureocillium takamizusanense]|uniref:Allantoate permease n=1 Tax=Purpureocillium takamizusanense TaxID=2060973 RepID=A0A9Q8QC97_9HYPO|nr:uncharacterized protein JDV02_003357 [Purpureocillium takamizusanense]UNI16975.1 hypothetical protein JDV02_003357 [Purpureocillium takamizusanense]
MGVDTNDVGSAVERERQLSVDADTEAKDHTDYERVDKELAKYVASSRIEISPEKNDELRRKIDKRVLAVMIATYFLQAIDKGTMSFASIMGIREDTNLTGQDNFTIARVPIAKYLSFNIVAWGTVLACTAACTTFAGLVTVRTLLGLFESVCQPAFVVMSSMWYRREEQAARVTYWYMMNGTQQIVGGLLAYCFSLITTGPLKSWQWIFLVYGVVSVIFGLFVGWWLPDSPMRAKCFSEEDKHLMVERVRDNQTGIQNREWKKHQFWEGLTDPQVWGYALVQLCTTLPTSGLGAFQGIIIKSFGFTTLQTQLLAMVLGFYIIMVLLASVWLVKKTSQNLLVMLGFVVPSFVGTICLMTVPLNTMGKKIGLVICYYITLSFWSAQTLALSMVSRNVAGQTKKSVAVAVNFIIWATGNAIGPQVFLDRDKPRYFIAFATHLGCYSLLVVVIVALRWYLVRQNRLRDGMADAGVREARDERMLHAFEDLTDRENPNFRYVY